MDDKNEGEPVPNPTGGESRKKKKARWDEMAIKINETVDALGRHLDKGIKDTVIALNLLGFETDSSCEGHTKHGECGPWLGLTSKEIEALEPERERIFEETRQDKKGYLDKKAQKRVAEIDAEKLKMQAKAMEVLAEFYQERRVPYDATIIVANIINGRIQCMGTEIAELLPPKQKAVKLKQYQEEMAAFTQFLKDRYFNG